MSNNISACTQEISNTTHLPAGSIALWWLGQASFAIRSSSLTILIDPFLSEVEGRLIKPPFTAETAPEVDFVLCTHEHLDHMDLPTLGKLAQHQQQTHFIVPRPLVKLLTDAGIEEARIQGVQPDEEHALGTAQLFPVPAMHAIQCPPRVYDFGFAESGGLYRYLGYMIEMDGVRLYHPGDTLVYNGLAEQLRGMQIDLALLPINGRNYYREQQHLVGNMDEREAADLAAEAGINAVIPTHYEMFSANTGRVGFFVDYLRARHPTIMCHILSHGRRFVYTR
ncbi:MBL fold metallo-hydrolase [Ktedonospora formicarum]|uniref:MBL fold metallo-hydrolase n=1 Tax=Ktedonospora formicarum TaxID=2778364 RepID=A0A8J3I0V9_9CHLR|nr:MBL fold metallo-hydrolase [Ktedonospora formicarum]GHO42849.1 MBL fold metallo-hydrolase [Ktedonospora formicarum]